MVTPSPNGSQTYKLKLVSQIAAKPLEIRIRWDNCSIQDPDKYPIGGPSTSPKIQRL